MRSYPSYNRKHLIHKTFRALKNDSKMELPYICDKEILFAEFRRLSELRHKSKPKEKSKALSKAEKQLSEIGGLAKKYR